MLRNALMILIVALLPVLVAGGAWADDGARLTRRTETGIKASKDRQVLTSTIWQPFYQEQDRVLFGEVRALGDNNDNFEGNIGLGYRQMAGGAIRGGYVYADHRVTALGSDIWQATIGGEYIKDKWEVRANAYLPFHAVNRFAVGDGAGPYVAGNGVYVRSAGEVIEEAQTGFDAEAGFHLPVFDDYVRDTRLYGGGYYFRGEYTPELLGARTRVEVDVNAWLRVGARAQYDEVRGTQYLAELTLRLPGVKASSASGLWARMSDSPERDVDVVTAAAVQAGAAVPVVDLSTGAPAHIIYVDNRADGSGDGSFEHPFNTLDTALAGAQAFDMVYVFTGDGTARGYDRGAVISAPNVTLYGQGDALYFDGTRFGAPASNQIYDYALLIPAGEHPLLSNTAGDGITVNADNAMIRGVQVDAALGDGLHINSGYTGTVVQNVRITGNDGAGIGILNSGANDMTLRVRDSVIAGNGGDGIIATQTNGGRIYVDLGYTDDYGFNDIYGNMGPDILADTGGVAVRAQGNYWGGGSLSNTAGVDAGLIDADLALTTPNCPECVAAVTGNFADDVNVIAGARTVSDQLAFGDFRGHRYIRVTGDGAPTFTHNGVDTGRNAVRVAAGDTIGVAMNAASTGLTTHMAAIDAGAAQTVYRNTTSILPNSLSNLIGWWDGRNAGVANTWLDQTGYGHDAVLSGVGDQMRVQNSFYLSALGHGFSVALVFDPADVNGSLFAYGDCGVTMASRCAAVAQGGTNDLTLRVDTNAGAGQMVAGPTVSDGTVHTMWLSALGDGTVNWSVDGAQTTGSYLAGGGFGNSAGLNFSRANYEVLLFNGAVDQADQNLLDAYFTGKWGI